MASVVLLTPSMPLAIAPPVAPPPVVIVPSVVQPFQMNYNGLTIGAGTQYSITALSGLEDAAPMRITDLQKPADHGSYQGADYLDVRTVEIDVTIVSDSQADYEAASVALVSAFGYSANELPLLYAFSDSTKTKQVNCRPSKLSLPRNGTYAGLAGDAVIQLIATDPRTYDSNLQILTCGLPGTGSGIVWPISWPISWGMSTAGGVLELTNFGSIDAPFVATINGPVVNPRIVNGTTGQQMAFTITLGSTDQLVVDFGAHTVTLNPSLSGGASRRGAVQPGSSWWTLPPAATTEILFFGALFAAGTLSCAYRSAWV